MQRRNFLFAAAAASTRPCAFAQDKAATIVVPYGPGGSLDTTARLLAEQLHRSLGRNFIVENKPGANGLIGTRAVQLASPDGNTLLFNGPNIVTLPVTNKEATYDPFKDFTPIACFGKVEYFLVVHQSTNAKGVADLVKFARTRPDGIFAGNAGNGSIGHMLAAAFAKAAGIKVTHVPYKGAADVMRALTAGEVHMQLTTTTAALDKLAQTGRVHYLAVASQKRSSFVSAVPTIREALPAMLPLESWSALFGPAGLPDPMTLRISAAVRTAMAEPEVVAKLAAQFISPLYLDPEGLKSAMVEAGAAQQRLRQEAGFTS